MGLLGMVKTYGWVNADNAIYILLICAVQPHLLFSPSLLALLPLVNLVEILYLGATLEGILTPALTNAPGCCGISDNELLRF